MNETIWLREGMFARPSAERNYSFMQGPTVLPLGADRWRIYYSTRDESNTSFLAAIDVDPADMRVIERFDPPLLENGEPGAFDHHGLGPSCALAGPDGAVSLYYAGIATRNDVPHEVSIGLATSHDGLHFTRACAGPVFSKGPYDPYYSSTPFVCVRDGAYDMWYLACRHWVTTPRGFESLYDVRRTRSPDGVVWSLDSTLALRARDLGGGAISRPWIAHDGTSDRLWFSLRGEDFRVGGSEPYRLWSVALDDAGDADLATAAPVRFANPATADDWDGHMQSSACVIARGHDLVMFYSGNAFGREGIGWARSVGHEPIA